MPCLATTALLWIYFWTHCEFSESSGDEYEPVQNEVAEIETPVMSVVMRAATHDDASGLVELLSYCSTYGVNLHTISIYLVIPINLAWLCM